MSFEGFRIVLVGFQLGKYNGTGSSARMELLVDDFFTQDTLSAVVVPFKPKVGSEAGHIHFVQFGT